MQHVLGLYQTLTATELPTKDMKSGQKKQLRQRLDELEDLYQKEAIVALIFEYARQNDDYTTTEEIKLPYRGKIIDGCPAFYLEKLPIQLKWLLWRFINIS